MAPAAHAGRLLAVLALVFNAFTWGVSWWPFRQLQDLGLHPLWLTALTFLVAVALITALRPAAWGELLRTPSLWVLVLASGTTNACFNWAVTVGDVVRVVLLFYLMPLWAVLLARLVLGERISALGLLRVALALGGALVVLRPADGGWPLPHSLPDALGLAGGFTFALNNVMLKREAGRSEAARALAMFAGGTAVSLVLALVLSRGGTMPWPPVPQPVWLLGALALAAWFLASNLALQFGAARLPANTTSVVMISEVVFASGSALALGAGTLSLPVLVGGGMIVAAALLAALRG
ncbi:MAG: EamA family transporter [Burkholderiales bacterium PBB5]|nr:MAG: EamA family transporter [Burkholderiales bacterium PBB5]